MNARLHDRLSALGLDVRPEVQTQHIATIAAALREPVETPHGVRAAALRRQLAAVAGTLALVGAPAAAVAAEGAVPGDALYPVKRVTETVRSWFDDTVAADHRIDELETVVERGAGADVVSDRLEDAERAVTDLGHPSVTDRLVRVRESLVGGEPSVDRPRDVPSDRPVDSTSTTTTTTTGDIAPSDQRSTTTAPPSDRSGDGVRPADGGDGSEPTGADVTDEPATRDRGSG